MTDLEVQLASRCATIPTANDLKIWLEAAMSRDDREIVIRVVDEAESTELNEQFRHKGGPTNVLSFPFEAPPGIECNLLGDLVICAPVVEREAAEQGKPVAAHWAHMVIHGALHLQGYDHIEDHEASVMESQEIALLKSLGFANPYTEVTGA